MDNILVKISVLYDKMGVAEKKVADYLLTNTSKIVCLSISELADLSGGSEATIVRFSKRLGFQGYQELKLALAIVGDYRIEKENISNYDNPSIVFNKVCDDIYSSLEKTKQIINQDVLTLACKKILESKRILIFGLGNSASVAADMAHKLLRLGFNAISYSDNHMQSIAAAHVDSSCIVIGISHSGSSKDIIDALKLAKINQSPVIAITDKGKSPIYKVSDYVINTDANETNYSLLGLSSRIAQLAIVDAIYYYLASHMENSDDVIQKTLNSLSSKKF